MPVSYSQTAPPPPPPIITPKTRAPTRGPLIAIVNRASDLNDGQARLAVAALQIQVDRDFAPVWNMGANLTFVGKGSNPPPGAQTLLLEDTSPDPGALGFHELDAVDQPIGHVFVRDDIKDGLSWTVTLSHELLEMIADPLIDSTVFAQATDLSGTLFALEVCDAVEDDILGYEIDGVLVSDFVTPRWFEGTARAGPFSFRQHVNGPFRLAAGGYIGEFIVGPGGRGWTQRYAQGLPGQRALNKRDRPLSRTMRRFSRAPEIAVVTSETVLLEVASNPGTEFVVESMENQDGT